MVPFFTFFYPFGREVHDYPLYGAIRKHYAVKTKSYKEEAEIYDDDSDMSVHYICPGGSIYRNNQPVISISFPKDTNNALETVITFLNAIYSNYGNVQDCDKDIVDEMYKIIPKSSDYNGLYLKFYSSDGKRSKQNLMR